MKLVLLVVFFGLAVLTVVGGIVVILSRFYRKVEQGKALIINRRKPDPEVTFTGGVVWPIINKAEQMDISVKTIEIDRRGKEGLICQDNIRADIKVTFFVRVNKTKEDVIKVAQAIGCVRASDQRTLEELFSAKFSEALKTVGKQLEFIDLYTKREEFRDQIIRVIGRDLNGYVLEDAAIDYLEQTPLSSLDGSNILDAQGIRKITELTTVEHVRTNQFQNEERKQIKKQDVEAAEAIYEQERIQADAEARMKKEIASVRAREEAETLKIQSEEHQRSEAARIKSEEAVGVADHNRWREVEVAEKHRQRVIAVEQERVEKDRQLEVIVREREVELQRIAKERELEVEKKLIADVVRERVAVDRTVAEEEERIKALRVVEEARRTKEASVITAEAEAEEAYVKEVRQAQALEEKAKHEARQRVVLAEAEFEAADRDAKATMRRAEGQQAAAAAEGLAAARVKEADAAATEKYGLAQVRVKEADADATEKVGGAEARVLLGRGEAEAKATEKKHFAEAAGIAKKAEAMRQLDPASREHEEYRLRLETLKIVDLAALDMRRDVASRQAEVLGAALHEAKVDIIGAEDILDRLTGAVAFAKGVDVAVGRSETAQSLLGDYLRGDASLLGDLKELLGSVSAQEVRDLSLSALVARLAASSSGERRSRLEKIQRLVDSPGAGEKKA